MALSTQRLAGPIELKLVIDRRGRVRAELVASRPTRIGRSFRGVAPVELSSRIGALFVICRQAQLVASSMALSAARGDDEPPNRRFTSLRVAAESLFEAARATCLTWPERFGITPDAEVAALYRSYSSVVAALSSERGGARQALGDRQLVPSLVTYAALARRLAFGKGKELPKTLSELLQWAHRQETASARFVAALLERRWHSLGAAELEAVEQAPVRPILRALVGSSGEAFAASPDVAGQPRETSALSRWRDHALVQEALGSWGPGLLTRTMARMVELEQLASTIDDGLDGERWLQWSPRIVQELDGWSVAIVPSARGMLIHALRLAAERVEDYRILAPTEWNFSARGPVIRSLEAMGSALDPLAPNERIEQARLVAGSYDPCVALEVTVEEKERLDA